ncbi:hypothetical protein FHW58_001288 [Duganella sp. 1224]|uniref:hypothetical protein n=1 Tax=Duganella sp. 1224 TaxID=2587052 RepID=UPI0015C94D88|nr:hypothetical protein [Duganella sp. 1224]NYE60136.1 hypothetical protein [Duganella sp. 1224]
MTTIARFIVLALLVTSGAAIAQRSEDPNLKGVKDDPRYQKDMLRDKDTRAAPGVDHSKANERYEQEKKEKAAKEKEKESLQKKYEKEKNN